MTSNTNTHVGTLTWAHTTYQQHWNKGMECSPTHDLIIKCKNYHAHIINDKSMKYIETPYHINKDTYKKINMIVTQICSSMSKDYKIDNLSHTSKTHLRPT